MSIPADDYEKMCATENLRRAYRWTLSNSDIVYKGYFRDAYAAYAASSDHNLRRLRKHLQRRAYDPGHASKAYLPKPSGILRPYTLLTVNDQIVYQACVNIVAHKLQPKVRSRYIKSIFGHLYAGKSSKFFYLKWQNGYRAYTNAILQNVKDGYKYVANFDLASFYDSIDHNVLRHFLNEIKIDRDLIDFLLSCLKTWTSSTWTTFSSIIYHEHGIPQGPLPSGLLSELVLKHIDDWGVRPGKTRYLRYVDDIKLFSKAENILRQRLISLDIASKEIGLFPQSAKVNIRKVINPINEIKTISNPPEPSLTPALDQKKLRARILQLTRRGQVTPKDHMRFKYLIARAVPHHTLNSRLIKVLIRQPAFYFQVSSYFSKYKQLPKKAAQQILEYFKTQEIYHAVHGSLLFATLSNMPDATRSDCIEFCYNRVFTPKRGLLRPQPTYKAALVAWLLKWDRLTYAEFHTIMTNEVDWWVAKDWIKYLSEDQYGKTSYESLLNYTIRDLGAEPARVGALKMVDDIVDVRNPYKNIQEPARLLLYAAGKLRTIGRPESLLAPVLSYILERKFALFDWEKLLGSKHKNAEHIAFTVKRNYETDINACIVTLDSLCDLIWETIFLQELPGKTYGNYGTILKNPTLVRKLSKAAKGLLGLHLLRLESVTAHPRNAKTGSATRRLKHHDFYKIRPHVRVAFDEIISKVKP